MADVLVVGAGPNGLAAAVAMAQARHRVVVHEATERIGGGTRTEALTLPGYLHDVCSAVHPMALASPFFSSLPLVRHGLGWVHPPTPMAHPFDDGTAAVLERDPRATAESLGIDGAAWRRLVRPFLERHRAFLDGVLAPPLRPPRHPVLMARFAAVGMVPALALARVRFTTDRARAFFLGMAAHTLLPMDRAPSAAFGLVLAVAGHGVGWPFAEGGSGALAAALASILASHGGVIHTGSRVRALDALPPADATLLDLTPRQFLAVAGGDLPARYRRALGRYRYGPGVCKVDWALSEPIPWRAAACRRAGTVHLSGSAGEVVRSAALAWRGEDDPRPYTIVTQPTLFDPSRAPAGRHTAWAYCHVPHASTVDMTARIEAQVERFAPGFRETVLARHARSAAAMEEHDTNLVGGDINGGVQDLRQLFFRPVVRRDPWATPLPGVYLCSASTPPGGAVHGMCGLHAARSALRRMG